MGEGEILRAVAKSVKNVEAIVGVKGLSAFLMAIACVIAIAALGLWVKTNALIVAG